jgi:phospholipid/cholesterol/gamma-HCH transport system substrate-binding protein
VAGAAVVAAVVAVAIVLIGPGRHSYTVTGIFQNASQLVKGDFVQVAGAPVGKVTDIELTPHGQAAVKMAITDPDYRPLRDGTQATVRAASLSGVANRYVDLRLPDGTHQQTIPDGGTLPTADTTSAVDLDQLFNTFDPKTRKALSGVVRGFAAAYGGRGAQANAGWMYLNPSLSTSSRLFRELDSDTPLFKRFVVASSSLVTDLAARRDDLSGLVDHLATTLSEIGSQKQALSSAIAQLPPFMRHANTTFVNLRATLDDLQPLIDETKPVARKLRPFLAELRPFAQDARPTLHDLAALLKRPGAANDLIDLTNLQVPLAQIAVGPVNRNGKDRPGALPESTNALEQSVPELASARPYAPDLTGWFDDFSHSGVYDALGGASRAAPYVDAFATTNGVLAPLIDPAAQQSYFDSVASLNQRWRCPGAAERGEAYKPAGVNCNLAEVPEGK